MEDSITQEGLLSISKVLGSPPFDFASDDTLLGIYDVCKKLNISRSTLERLRRPQELAQTESTTPFVAKDYLSVMLPFPEPTVMLGRSPRWSTKTLSQWIEGSCSQTVQEVDSMSDNTIGATNTTVSSVGSGLYVSMTNLSRACALSGLSNEQYLRLRAYLAELDLTHLEANANRYQWWAHQCIHNPVRVAKLLGPIVDRETLDSEIDKARTEDENSR